MIPTGIPVQGPTTPPALPQVTLVQLGQVQPGQAQPGQTQPGQTQPGQTRMVQGNTPGWTPARRIQPMMGQNMTRPVRSAMSGVRVGQGEAQLWARGSDIAFSILTGLAAIVSGIGVIINFGKGEASRRGMVSPMPGAPPRPAMVGRPSRPVWYVIGGAVALLGVANIWSSINRAAALQPMTVPIATTPGPTAQTTQ